MVTTIPHRAPFTVDDIARFPDDGNRYELIEGDLHVSAAPTHAHQRVVRNLSTLLDLRHPPDLEVLFAPLDVVLGPNTVLEPDLLVIPASEVAQARIEGPPLLVVEVLSPSTRHYDVGTKRPVYREAGVPALWVVDPEVPSVTEWRWQGGAERRRRVEGEDALTIDWPFAVTLVPARLVEPGGWSALVDRSN